MVIWLVTKVFLVCSAAGCVFRANLARRYGVPGSCSKGFEKCLAKILGEPLENVAEHLYRITKMLSPVYLQQAQVRRICSRRMFVM